MKAAVSLLTAAGGILVGALVVGAAYGTEDGLVTAALLAIVAAVGLGGAHALTTRRRALGPLRRQLNVGGGVAICALLAAVGLGAGGMFVSTHDAVVVAVLALFGGLVAARAAALLSGDLMAEIDDLGTGLAAVGAGDRSARLPVRGADELSELAAAVNATSATLARAEQARADLIAAVSHDLRTPITSLGLLAQAIDDDIVDAATRRRYVAQMGTHLRAMGGLIDDLFELARLEAGETDWSVGRVPLDALVSETVDALGVAARRGRVSLEADVAVGLVAAEANPEKLQRVLVNLLDNAIRHTPAGAAVTITGWQAGGELGVEVANPGDPIPVVDRERIFEPFYRGGTEAARTRSGAGLGLAISRAIVEAHGGRIGLVADDARTRVRITLPAARPPAPAGP